MSHLRSVPDPPTETVEEFEYVTRLAGAEGAPHPPTICIRCGAPTRVTTETQDPSGIHRTFLLCENQHGMGVHWGENA